MMTTTATRMTRNSMHALSDWWIVGIIVVSFTVGYVCALLAHKDDILH